MRTALFIVLALTLFQCKKDKNFQVEGVVYDTSFKTNSADTKVELFVLKVGSINKYDLLESITTGSDGKYSFTFKREKVEGYKIVITKPNYFELVKEFTNDVLSLEDVNTFPFDISAKSWVRIHFQNVDVQQPLTFVKQEGKSDCADCCPATEQKIPAIQDTSIYCINDGNFKYGILYKVGSIPNIVSVNTTAFDTTELKVVY